MALNLNPIQETKAPPAKGKPGPKPRVQSTSAKTKEREDGVNGLFQLAAASLLLFGQFPDAGACQLHGPNIARETAALSEQSPGVARVIDYITAAGPYAAIIGVMMPFGLQLLVNHERIPASPALAQFGVYDPAILRAQAEMEATRQRMEIQRQAQLAQTELEEMLRDEAANA